jgi:hypothetical protein
MVAVSLSAAHAQDDLRDLNDDILENPQDAELNLRYARLAEQQGKLRLALAAYERVLINHPDNEEAQRGFTRVRRIMEPSHTSLRVEIGARWDTNPQNLKGSDQEAHTIFGRATVADERRLGSKRWRSNVNFLADITPEITELNYVYLGAQTGPVIDLAPNLAAVASIGAGVASLDGGYYYDDINAGVTLEGRKGGVSVWTRFRAGWRNYSEESTAEQGVYAELIGGVSVPRVATESDTFVFVPWVRWSDIEGSAFNFLNEEIAPDQYTEYGAEANYYYAASDHVILSVGALAYDRYYTRTTVGTDERHDTYVAPQASVTLRNALPCECSLRVTYRYRHNSSNDEMSDYNAQQVSVALFTSF